MYNTGSETGLLATCRIATYHGALLHVSQDFNGKLFPLLVKEGWPRHQKMVPFRKGADGVVARESRFALRFETSARERPPRLRRFGGFATFY